MAGYVPFDILVLRRLGSEGTTAKTFDKIVAQIHKLCRFLLLRGRRTA